MEQGMSAERHPEASRRTNRKKEIPMVDSVRSEGNGANKPLAKKNVAVAKAGTPLHAMTPEAIKGMVINPIYAGVGPFPRLVEDEAWVRGCETVIKEEGPEQFLVNLLYVLRETFDEGLLRSIYGS
jgi:hypothetical protein